MTRQAGSIGVLWGPTFRTVSRIVGGGAVLALALLLAHAVAGVRRVEAAEVPARPVAEREGPAFSLTDQYGRRVTEATLADKPVVLHFGFTSCPAICPTTLFEVAARMRELGPLADEIHFVFVTADPERDTPEILKSFAASFDERIIALSGDVAQTAALAKGLGASFAKVPTPDGYTIDHSVNGFLLSRGWKLGRQMYLGADSRADHALAALYGMIGQKLLSGSPPPPAGNAR